MLLWFSRSDGKYSFRNLLSLLIDTYINTEQEKMRLFNGIETIPCVAKKAKWAFKMD